MLGRIDHFGGVVLPMNKNDEQQLLGRADRCVRTLGRRLRGCLRHGGRCELEMRALSVATRGTPDYYSGPVHPVYVVLIYLIFYRNNTSSFRPLLAVYISKQHAYRTITTRQLARYHRRALVSRSPKRLRAIPYRLSSRISQQAPPPPPTQPPRPLLIHNKPTKTKRHPRNQKQTTTLHRIRARRAKCLQRKDNMAHVVARQVYR